MAYKSRLESCQNVVGSSNCERSLLKHGEDKWGQNTGEYQHVKSYGRWTWEETALLGKASYFLV